MNKNLFLAFSFLIISSFCLSYSMEEPLSRQVKTLINIGYSEENELKVIELLNAENDRSIEYTVENANILDIIATYGIWVNLIPILKQRGIDLDEILPNGFTILTKSAMHGHTEVVKMLIEYGVDVNKKNKKGNDALELAVRYNHAHKQTDTLRLLAEKANLASKNNALLLAVNSTDPSLINILLDNGADINVGNDKWKTPLMKAAFYGNQQSVQTLLDRNADVNTEDRLGKTAMHHAIWMGRLEAVKLIANSGRCDFKAGSYWGGNVYEYAKRNGCKEVVEEIEKVYKPSIISFKNKKSLYSILGIAAGVLLIGCLVYANSGKSDNIAKISKFKQG